MKNFMRSIRELFSRHPSAFWGLAIILAIVLMAMLAPWLGTVDPQAISPRDRLKFPNANAWFGTDMLGRDVYSRTLYGARISLLVGFSVATASTLVGLVLGLVTGFNRRFDAVFMRVMDGLMSVPGVLLAIALMALSRPSLVTVFVAITVVEIPRVVRVVRGEVISLRDRPFVQAAISVGTGPFKLLRRHILPNAVAPVIVQASYIFASAMLLEAVLSFIGAGVPPNVPSWGNIMADGRSIFQNAYYVVLIPGAFLSLAVLSINLIGDGLRDAMDPRFIRR